MTCHAPRCRLHSERTAHKFESLQTSLEFDERKRLPLRETAAIATFL